MSKAIYKYPLVDLEQAGHTNRIQLEMSPRRIVHMDIQDGVICLWAEVLMRKGTCISKPVQREFIVAGTGEEFGKTYEYIGTVQHAARGYVWHILENKA